MELKNVILALFVLISPASFAADIKSLLNEEIESYITDLEGAEGESLISVASRITRSGLTDPRLFDKVNDILLDKHRLQMTTAREDEIVVHQIVNLLRTLASTGRSEYSSTLRLILGESKNRAVRNRAKHLLSKRMFYQDKNRIMNQLENHKEGQTLHSTRLINLLNNKSLIMNRFAAEEIVREGAAEEAVQELIAERLEQEVRLDGSKLQTDTLAWYAKVLGTVNREKYLEFLTGISKDKSVEYHIRRHTKRILKDNAPDRWNK